MLLSAKRCVRLPQNQECGAWYDVTFLQQFRKSKIDALSVGMQVTVTVAFNGPRATCHVFGTTSIMTQK